MNLFCKRFFYVWALIMGFSLFENTALAQNIPKPVEGSWVVRDFKFSTGETLPELKLNYTTIGNPSGDPVLVLHGTTVQPAS